MRTLGSGHQSTRAQPVNILPSEGTSTLHETAPEGQTPENSSTHLGTHDCFEERECYQESLRRNTILSVCVKVFLKCNVPIQVVY